MPLDIESLRRLSQTVIEKTEGHKLSDVRKLLAALQHRAKSAPEIVRLTAVAAFGASMGFVSLAESEILDFRAGKPSMLARRARKRVEEIGDADPESRLDQHLIDSILDPLNEHGTQIGAAIEAAMLFHFIAASKQDDGGTPQPQPANSLPEENDTTDPRPRPNAVETPLSTETSPAQSDDLDGDTPTDPRPISGGTLAIGENPKLDKAFLAIEEAQKQASEPHRPLGTPPHTSKTPSNPSSDSEPKATQKPPQPRTGPNHLEASLRSSSRPSSDALRAPSIRSGQAAKLSHKKRPSSDLTAEQIAHRWLAQRACEERSTPLNIAIMVRLEATPAYKAHWSSKKDSRGKARSPNSAAERAKREQARGASVKALERCLENIRRVIPAFCHVTVLELPAKTGSGLHVHISAHVPDAASARLAMSRIATLTGITAGELASMRSDPALIAEMTSKHHLPFDVRGESSFLRDPEARLMTRERSWDTAGYQCKSAAGSIPAGDGTLGDIRPEQDTPGHPMRAYQPQMEPDSADVMRRRVRTSANLKPAALAREGWTLDKAPDAGWLHAGYRREGNKARWTTESSNKISSVSPKDTMPPTENDIIFILDKVGE